MAIDGPGFLLKRAWRGQYGPLLMALLTLCLTAPALTGGRLKGGLLDLAQCGIVLAGVHAAAPGRRSIVVGLALAGLTLGSHRLVTVAHDEVLHAAHYALVLSVLAYTARTILAAVVRDSVVTPETIKGAVCVYLLLGLIWVYVFVVIDMASPGSFRLPLSSEGEAEGHLLVHRQLHQLLYFSFSTLTTLGYGDIVPLRGAARTACYLEAVVGQIYLTVLVARLVGMHITRPPRDIPPGNGGGDSHGGTRFP